MKTILFLLFSIAFANIGFTQIPITEPEEVGMSSERLNRFTELSKQYVDSSKVAGIVTMVARKGKLVYFEAFGNKGMDDSRPIQKDDLFRIYSMTKPITAVALMQLYEKGLFHLNDPVEKYVPEFKDLKVLSEDGTFVAAKKKMTMQQLLTHTTGLSYGFNPNDVIDKLYGEAELWKSKDLDDFITKLSKIPLKFEPGKKWHYSVAVDVTGLIVQRLSKQPFDEYLDEHIFQPLGMTDTFFEVPKNKASRFLPNHYFDPSTKKPKTIVDTTKSAMTDYSRVTLFSGGGGLVSTAMDYMLFSECIRNGGELKGVRILSPKTVAYMAMDHLPASLDHGDKTDDRGRAVLEANVNGFGFGLGFAVISSTTASRVIGSDGEFNWGGAAGTIFWIDPVEEIVVVSMIQLMGSPWNLRSDLKVAAYQAIIESYD